MPEPSPSSILYKDFDMRLSMALALVVSVFAEAAVGAEGRLPRVFAYGSRRGGRSNWRLRPPDSLSHRAPRPRPMAPVYLGSDPMDMPGPPTQPIDRVLAIKDGKIATFADKLWSVMGLEWIDARCSSSTLHFCPRCATGRRRNGRRARRPDDRPGPAILPGFNGINDHVASGIRLGMDGFLYISVGDKGIPKGIGRDGKTIQLFGGGVIRVRPDGTGLEVVSTGERNPLSVALSATDEIFTYGNDDDSKRWPNSLTHHIVGGHYGYPYQFSDDPSVRLADHGGTASAVRARRGSATTNMGCPTISGQPLLLRLGPPNS